MVGIDLIKTARMERLMQRFGDKALEKFLSDDEIKLVKNHTTAAGFWATKEAFSKALGTGIGASCSFHEIKIYKSEKGAPKLALSHRLVKEFSIVNTALSITHDGEYAVAVVTIKTSSPTDKVKEF